MYTSEIKHLKNKLKFPLKIYQRKMSCMLTIEQSEDYVIWEYVQKCMYRIADNYDKELRVQMLEIFLEHVRPYPRIHAHSEEWVTSKKFSTIPPLG